MVTKVRRRSCNVKDMPDNLISAGSIPRCLQRGALFPYAMLELELSLFKLDQWPLLRSRCIVSGGIDESRFITQELQNLYGIVFPIQGGMDITFTLLKVTSKNWIYAGRRGELAMVGKHQKPLSKIELEYPESK